MPDFDLEEARRILARNLSDETAAYFDRQRLAALLDRLEAAERVVKVSGAMDAFVQHDPEHLRCADCSRFYFRGPDVWIPDEAWEKIAPKSGGGGVLCPNCIHDRLVAAGFKDHEAPGRFTSGPLAALPTEEPE